MTGKGFETLEIGAAGLDRSDWIAGFFPADLPVEWRLSYYANEFDTVLLPVALWGGEAVSQATAWYEDVPERFRFYMELDADALERPGTKGVLVGLDALAPVLGGLVLRTKARVAGEAGGLRKRYPGIPLVVDGEKGSQFPRLWRPGESGGAGPIGLAGFDSPPDAMTLRRTIESFISSSSGSQRTLFLEAPHETLEMANTIVRLLGY